MLGNGAKKALMILVKKLLNSPNRVKLQPADRNKQCCLEWDVEAQDIVPEKNDDEEIHVVIREAINCARQN